MSNGQEWNGEERRRAVKIERSDTLGNIAAAKAKAQAKFTPLGKDKSASVFSQRTGKSYSYAYADLATCLDAVIPALSEVAIAVFQPTRIESGAAVATTLLVHDSGEWLSGDFEVAIVDPSDARSVGSAATYARRYGLLSVLGYAPGDEDDDGAQARGGDHEMAKSGPALANLMPREKPQEAAVAAKPDTQAGAAESGTVAQPSLPEVQDKPKKMKNEEAKAEAAPPEPKPKAPAVAGSNAASGGPGVAQGVSDSLAPFHVEFTIGKTAWRTRGMTEGQVMESFGLEAALRNRKLFDRFRPALVNAIGLPADHPDIHRKNLTKEQAEVFIASLYDIMPDLMGSKTGTVTS